ncbi:MAG: hypothetical protein GVY35_13155 [Bacteroidetes bacterium]|nr:hypothetical protein [Bacteroidota bacterium]
MLKSIPAIAVILLFVFSGCDETPTGPEESGPEERGALTITTTSDAALRGLEYCVGDKCKAPNEEGVTRFTDVAPGEYEVELNGLSDRCVVDGENPRMARVMAAEAAEVSFDVRCPIKLSGDMAFVSDHEGQTDLYVADPPPSNLYRPEFPYKITQLTDDRGTEAEHVSASADGKLYVWGNNSHGQLGDGSRSSADDGDDGEEGTIFGKLLEGNSTYPITDRGADPTLSADGEWVAFSRDGDLFVKTADGSGEARRLTDTTRVSASDPDFSPDGTEILFAQKAKDAGGDICWSTHILDVETKETRRVGDHCQPFSPDPAYSPDGTEIVTVREDDSGIRNLHVQRTDGSATDGSATGVWITPFEGEGRLDAWANPCWSSDGHVYYISAPASSASPAKATNHNATRSNRSNRNTIAPPDTDIIDVEGDVTAVTCPITQ